VNPPHDQVGEILTESGREERMPLDPDRFAESHDFDFLMGAWRVHHRKLKSRLSGCTEWIESDGTSVARPMMGGLANVDDNEIEGPDGAYRACSFRVFDPSTSTWSIWWFDSRSPSQLDPPLVGRFEGHVGSFFSDDSIQGRPIRVRFLWTATDTGSPHWEQAFSADGGLTWETNWTMDFTGVNAGRGKRRS
jgi:hypothetical protein